VTEPLSQPPLLTVGSLGLSSALGFHPAVAAWFESRFSGGPTEPQRRAWPAIATGSDVLVAAPTGTGKTLTGFLVAIDAAWRAHDAGDSPLGGPRVVYISPLRALAADVSENLEGPIEGIASAARMLGLDGPNLRVGLRTGDSSPSERAALRKNPPDLLVTTPESLYLLLTSASGRRMLRHARTVIVDEIHAVCRDKRGSHLSLSLERFSRLVADEGRALQRIGLSATQRPIETVAKMLSGVGPSRPGPVVIDCSAPREFDVAIELPTGELETAISTSQMGDVLDRIASYVLEHRTTLVFVNTRRMAERVAHQLAERLSSNELGVDDASLVVAAHHGSLSTARRRQVEARLRRGDLRALVATASLELGIDVGPVELVCQLGSPRAIGTFLQRIGRANHRVDGTPKGRLFPLNRDELVECTALLMAVRVGDLDRLVPPVAPLDVLIQQLVAEVAARGEATLDELYAMVIAAAPYVTLSRERFDEALDVAARGIVTGRGRRGAHLHLDGVNGVVRPRRGAGLAALLGAGAIPELGEYRVVLDPDGVTVGSVHEDFAIEAATGDVFLLGTHSWRVLKVETGTVRVADANGMPPTTPFWLGEAPARTPELSAQVSALRELVEIHLAAEDPVGARAAVCVASCVSHDVAAMVVAYMEAGRRALGVLPTTRQLVVERFFDEAEAAQLVIHAPYGGRINRALGLALRKRFCVTFDFELQAAANDDAVTIALGPHHSFPLSDVVKLVPAGKAREVLTQAVLPLPMLAARWRWNVARALVMPRATTSGRRPIHLLRMEADDLMAATWPALAACQENAPAGPISVPDHPLVRQTVDDVLFEPLDVDGLEALLGAIESGEVAVRFVESPEPSVFAHGILNGAPWTFLDDAPLEERRSRAVGLTRGLGPIGADGLPSGLVASDPLDEEVVAAVVASAVPRVRSADELHELISDLVVVRPVEAWSEFARELAEENRLQLRGGEWVTVERANDASEISLDDTFAADCIRGHLQHSGPVTVEQLVSEDQLGFGPLRGAPLSVLRTRTALAALEAQGYAIALPDSRWCARHLLARCHALARQRRRRYIQPVTLADYVDFLCEWQRVEPASRFEGRSGVLAAIEQLQGIELPAGDWESHVLPARVANYDPTWLDELCLAGEVAWVRLTPRPQDEVERRGAATPSAATPLALVRRDDLGWLLWAVRLGESPSRPPHGSSIALLEALELGGAQFRAELAASSGRLPAEVDEGLWDLVARGIATADAFSAVRSLLDAKSRFRARQRRLPNSRLARAPRRALAGSGVGEGRWSIISAPQSAPEGVELEELAERAAVQLLVRWGVVAYELTQRESMKVPWRHVVWALRRLEARGEVNGGRFVAGLSGEQYATRDATIMLATRREGRRGQSVTLSGSDPINLTGGVLGSPRVPGVRHRYVTIEAGDVSDAAS
jgi:ATP-dependent helicase Lhr and Lhr-like helicase